MEKELRLFVAPSPHLRSGDKVSGAMRDVIIALLPITIVAIALFKLYAVFLIAVCLVTAALTELIFRKVMGKQATLYDGSAILTGLLVALCFSAGTPWWTAALATFIGVGVAKELVGGLGWNRFNPALFGRVSVILLVPVFQYITGFFAPLRQYFGAINPLDLQTGAVDTVTTATPLALLAQGEAGNIGSLFLFHQGGGLGESSALALILGGLYLVFRKHITLHIPVAIIVPVLVLGLLDTGGAGAMAPIAHVLTGGVLLGAFFMATDWVTSPINTSGKIIFGLCIGVLIMVFRLWLAPVEGTAFAILIMNAFVPAIDKATRRLTFGATKEASA